MAAEVTSLWVLLLGTPVALIVATLGLVQFKTLFLALTALSQKRGNAKLIRRGKRVRVQHAEPRQ